MNILKSLGKLIGLGGEDPPADRAPVDVIDLAVKRAIEAYTAKVAEAAVVEAAKVQGGVTPTAPVPPVDSSPATAAPYIPRADRFTVTVIGLEESYRRSAALQVLRTACLVTLKEAQVLFDNMPIVIEAGVSQEESEYLMGLLAEGGFISSAMNETAMTKAAIALRKEAL